MSVFYTGKPALSRVHVLKRDVKNNQTVVQVFGFKDVYELCS